MNTIEVGSFVRVVSGPAFTPGALQIKGRVREIFTGPSGETAALVKVASGGEWGFDCNDLRVMPKHASGCPCDRCWS